MKGCSNTHELLLDKSTSSAAVGKVCIARPLHFSLLLSSRFLPDTRSPAALNDDHVRLCVCELFGLCSSVVSVELV